MKNRRITHPCFKYVMHHLLIISSIFNLSFVISCYVNDFIIIPKIVFKKKDSLTEAGGNSI